MTGPNLSHTAAPRSGWTQLSSSNTVAFLGLGKEIRGPRHPLCLKKVRKHNTSCSAAGELKQVGCQGIDLWAEQFRSPTWLSRCRSACWGPRCCSAERGWSTAKTAGNCSGAQAPSQKKWSTLGRTPVLRLSNGSHLHLFSLVED